MNFAGVPLYTGLRDFFRISWLIKPPFKALRLNTSRLKALIRAFSKDSEIRALDISSVITNATNTVGHATSSANSSVNNGANPSAKRSRYLLVSRQSTLLENMQPLDGIMRDAGQLQLHFAS